MTAQEFLYDEIKKSAFDITEAPISISTKAMISFAQFHVELALKAASEHIYYVSYGENGSEIIEGIKQDVLNSYPLDNLI